MYLSVDGDVDKSVRFPVTMEFDEIIQHTLAESNISVRENVRLNLARHVLTVFLLHG